MHHLYRYYSSTKSTIILQPQSASSDLRTSSFNIPALNHSRALARLLFLFCPSVLPPLFLPGDDSHRQRCYLFLLFRFQPFTPQLPGRLQSFLFHTSSRTVLSLFFLISNFPLKPVSQANLFEPKHIHFVTKCSIRQQCSRIIISQHQFVLFSFVILSVPLRPNNRCVFDLQSTSVSCQCWK